MKYKKIKVLFKDCPERFNRTLLVSADIDLSQLGCVLTTVLGATYEHYFMFSHKGRSYVPYCFLKNDFFEEDVPLKDYSLSSLPNKFTYLYDTGDGWEFEVRVYKKEIEKQDKRIAILLSGAGQGIWEDNIGVLWAYLDGEIKNLTEEDEEEGIYFPWNFDIQSFAEFDTPLDIPSLSEEFDHRIKKDIRCFEKKMNPNPNDISTKKSA